MRELGIAFETYLENYRFKYLALYHALREAIVDGSLPAGSRLPSTRRLAELYDLSRGSVAEAYDMLLAEGYVTTEKGSGTFVAPGGRAGQQDRSEASTIRLSSWGERVMKDKTIAWTLQSDATIAGHDIESELHERSINFTEQGTRPEYFPYDKWRRTIASVGRLGAAEHHEVHEVLHPAGDPKLRAAIAGHLRTTRGIRTEASRIVLFNGSMQGIVLLIQLLVNQGDRVVIENPGYHGIRRAVLAAGGICLPSPIDEHGLIPCDWHSRLLFVTPSRQYPTGAVLTLQRRRQLLDWAVRQEAIIVEDDYDSEFRWGGRPIEPLKALDQDERVIYLGSFSKTMFSSLRLGFAVLPEGLVEPMIQAKALYEPYTANQLEQRALARFITRGEYGRHLRRMTRIYGELQSLFRNLMEKRANHLFELVPGDAGLHVYAKWLHSEQEFAAFKEAAALSKVGFRDAVIYDALAGPPAACFGLAHLNAEEISEGVNRLAAAWENVQR